MIPIRKSKRRQVGGEDLQEEERETSGEDEGDGGRGIAGVGDVLVLDGGVEEVEDGDEEGGLEEAEGEDEMESAEGGLLG